MSFIVNATTSYPEHSINQVDFFNFISAKWASGASLVNELFNTNPSINSKMIASRNFTLPLNYYPDLNEAGKRNIIWKAEACELQIKNLNKIFEETSVDIKDIGLIVSATSSGIMIPGLEVYMMNKFPFLPNTKRLPVFGLGALAGVAGINKINDYLIAYPDKAALLLVTELPSLSFEFNKEDLENLLRLCHFGDASGAVLMVGNDHPLAKNAPYEVLLAESIIYPETQALMGTSLNDTGLNSFVSKEVHNIFKTQLVTSVDNLLGENKISRNDISFYIVDVEEVFCLTSICDLLDIPKEKLALSWEGLSRYGNTASVTAIDILKQTIFTADIVPNQLGLMIALGPGMGLELSLIKKN
ncbi:MAG: 3-oxoacyl-[acyl-carrier-protein] synthase III C-terminal domain-containing protein [Bacteriovorax sp.]|nr:3-oxoacyl-[acyl-carrier-protein] synthase III C-terminal domain-containing protein [Bacteriovorax sp.]